MEEEYTRENDPRVEEYYKQIPKFIVTSSHYRFWKYNEKKNKEKKEVSKDGKE